MFAATHKVVKQSWQFCAQSYNTKFVVWKSGIKSRTQYIIKHNLGIQKKIYIYMHMMKQPDLKGMSENATCFVAFFKIYRKTRQRLGYRSTPQYNWAKQSKVGRKL
jgi:hypothetical protein